MSVLCCRLPDPLIDLACRQTPAWAGKPLALLGPDERVWAASPAAARCGVSPAMRPQQAQIACPDVLLRPLDIDAAQAEQDAFVALLAEWELPVEPQTWGMAYVDLHSVAKTADTVRPLAGDLGRRLRRQLGQTGSTQQPALGWDSGKFTARAAAVHSAPGRMRLVDKTDEVRFLGPLPVTLLPLPQPHMQQLHWLGIRTLGQFAHLPAAAVWQRFGAAGKQAQRWAQGHDDRPVRPAVAQTQAPQTVGFDPPTGLLQPVVEAVMASLHPLLQACADRLEGLRRLRLTLSFLGAEERSGQLLFVEPAIQPGRVQAALVQHLCTLRWPGELESVQWTLLECGELVAPQLTLFPEPPQRLAALDELAEKLSGRYAAALFHATVAHTTHPAHERRSALTLLR